MKGIILAVVLTVLMFPALGFAHDAHEWVVPRDHRHGTALRRDQYTHQTYFHGQIGHHHHGTIIIFSVHRRYLYPRLRVARYKRLHRHFYSYRTRHRYYR